MSHTTWGPAFRQASGRIAAFLSSRLPFLVTVGCVLLLNWGSALWLMHYLYHEREAAVFQLATDELKYVEQKMTALFRAADRTLLELRAVHAADRPAGDVVSGERARIELGGWTPASQSGGIAFVAPDGHVVAASANASTAGWSHLMARLATSGDVLAIGEPVLSKTGHLSFLPLARRVVRPDGSFGGILMYSLENDALPALSPAVAALDGCMSLMSDDGVILARAPDVRGIVGIRVAKSAIGNEPRGAPTVIGRATSSIDGVDRISASRHLDGMPASLNVGIGYDAAFANWETIRWIALATRAGSTTMIILAGYFWYTRRHRARISGEALATILANVEHGIRVGGKDGAMLAANDLGSVLPLPEGTEAPVEFRRQDGGPVAVRRHDLAGGGTVLIGTDLTAQARAEARIDFLLSHDPLTRLPNRWNASGRIGELLAARAANPRLAALILLDLDGFQNINDTLGYEGGDEALIEVARRLRGLAAKQDVVARLGGDEFLFCLDDPDDEAAVTALARLIPRAVARTITVRGQPIHLGLSMGIALYPRDATDTAGLFRAADIALSRAKRAGRGTAQRFDPEMMVSFEENRMLESDLRHALDSNLLEFRLQPQFSCESLEVTGFEMLTRWRHVARGEISPAVFIPAAERSGLINPLGLWAIEQACKAAAAWSTRYRVAVNLSPLQLRGDSIQEDIRAILRRTQFPAHLLELEVTESVLLDEDQRALETLHKLRAMDIRITLDDFGAGYSSLSYLRRFPFDKIKIDKTFIESGGTDRATRVILEAMIRMCGDLGFDVVAEGVETEAQLTDLRQLGCREVQGFLLSAPLRPEAVESFLTSHGQRLAPHREADAVAS